MTKKVVKKKKPAPAAKKSASQETTEIICILDRSTSIRTSGLVLKTIEGYNAFIADQKKQPGKAKFTLCLFDGVARGTPKEIKATANAYEVVHNGIDIKDVPDLNEKTFDPKGMTALYDAIGSTLDAALLRIGKLSAKDKPDKVVVLIMTDGEENSSDEYTLDDVKAKIESLKTKEQWGFVFIGANIDAFAAGGGLGVAKGAVLNYANTSSGVQTAYANMSSSVNRVRAMSRTSMDSVSFMAAQDNLIADNDDDLGNDDPKKQ